MHKFFVLIVIIVCSLYFLFVFICNFILLNENNPTKIDKIGFAVNSSLLETNLAPHTLFEIKSDLYKGYSCKYNEDIFDTNYLIGQEFFDGNQVTVDVQNGLHEKYMQLCISKSDQIGYNVDFTAKSIKGCNCKIYFSVHNPHPSELSWDWKIDQSGTHSISIKTYVAEFSAQRLDDYFLIYFVILSSSSTCHVSINVTALTTSELLSKAGSLRGQILLPRDIKKKNIYLNKIN